MPQLFKDRRRGYLELDDLLKLVDQEGNFSWLMVIRDEPLHITRLQFADATNAVAATTGVTGYVQVEPLAPARENRLFQVRPYIYAVDRATGVRVPDDQIPDGVELQVEAPAGMRRYGTDNSRDTTFNSVTNAGFGGVNGGVSPWLFGPGMDLDAELWDLFLTYASIPGFQVRNRSAFAIGGATDNRDWFLGFVGRKYLLGEALTELVKKAEARMLEYRGITVGGIPLVTTRV